MVLGAILWKRINRPESDPNHSGEPQPRGEPDHTELLMIHQIPQSATSPSARAPIAAATETIGPASVSGAATAERWRRNSSLAGLAISLFVHTLLLLILALSWLDRPAGAGSEDEEAVELAVISRQELSELLSGSLGPARLIVEDQGPTLSLDDLTSAAPIADLAPVATDPGALAAVTGAGSGDSRSGGPMDSLLSAGNQARFFGIEARGNRFAYVIDVSGSMEGERAKSMKTALIASIENLSDEASFAIILYNDRAVALTGDGWVRSGDASRATSRQRIAAISVGGGTNPAPAFELTQALKPPPDAIYFMTDGEFIPDAEALLLSTVTRMMRSGDSRLPIHGISFVTRGAEKFMRRLAAMTRGSYTFVEGPRR